MCLFKTYVVRSDDRKLHTYIHILAGLDVVVLYVCKCMPAPQQLIRRGLFPCAPVLPKLAIELDMLELAAGLFVNSSPNETAWAATLTEFLGTRGYSLSTEVGFHFQLLPSLYLTFHTSKDSLRRRFGNALAQYQVLIQVVDAEVSKSVEVARNLALAIGVTPSVQQLNAELPEVNGSAPLFHRSYLNSESQDGHVPQSKSGEPRQRPSAYLRSRCPLCFGGKPPVPQENTSVCLCCAV